MNVGKGGVSGNANVATVAAFVGVYLGDTTGAYDDVIITSRDAPNQQTTRTLLA